jgi:hypothetical protein
MYDSENYDLLVEYKDYETPCESLYDYDLFCISD